MQISEVCLIIHFVIYYLNVASIFVIVLSPVILMRYLLTGKNSEFLNSALHSNIVGFAVNFLTIITARFLAEYYSSTSSALNLTAGPNPIVESYIITQINYVVPYAVLNVMIMILVSSEAKLKTFSVRTYSLLLMSMAAAFQIIQYELLK